MRLRPLALLALFACASLGAEPRFVGLVVSSGGARFAVADSEGGAARWLVLGERCDGYTLVSFQSAEQALVLEKAGVLSSLLLAPAKVMAAELDTARLASVALAEVRSREGWDERVRPEPLQRYGDLYRVLVREEMNGQIQARMVILTKFGEIRGYFKLTGWRGGGD